jgi:sulfatase modifying factor 1
MNARNIKFGLACTLILGLTAGTAVAQGNLTPANAPAPTMHTLEEIYQQVATLEARLDTIEQQTAGPIPAGMVLIPAGDFVMGDAFDPEGETDELPVHTSTISAFYMDATEVTKAKWSEVRTWALANGYTFDNTGQSKAVDHPVHTVNWYDCVKWANARSEMDGLMPCYLADTTTGTVYRTGALAPTCDWYANGYRLPTEAEWEKAARGGAPGTRFPWTGVDTIQHARANYQSSSSIAYDTSATSGNHPDAGTSPRTMAVGSFAPNGYGLHDMAGNLYEWCWDWYGSTYYSSSPSADPYGPGSGTGRVVRGGYWSSFAGSCRVADRNSTVSPGVEANSVGFRLVRATQ